MDQIFSFEATGDLARFLERLKVVGQGVRSDFIRQASETKLAEEKEVWEGRISEAIRELLVLDEK